MKTCEKVSKTLDAKIDHVHDEFFGQIKKQKPEWVISSIDGGPDIITRKLGIHGPEERLKPFEVKEDGLRFTEKDYIKLPASYKKVVYPINIKLHLSKRKKLLSE